MDFAYHINCNIETATSFLDILPEKLPTAFVCQCDSTAHTLYIALRYRNLNVPNDISVISFDDTPLCKSLNPPLSSYGIQKDKIAKSAFFAMIDLLNHKQTSNHILTPSLHLRGSVKIMQEHFEIK